MSGLRMVVGTAAAAGVGLAVGGAMVHRDAGVGARPPLPPLTPALVASVTEVAAPAAAPPPTARFLLGINEAVAVPHKAVAQGSFRAEIDSHLERDATRAVGLGARLVRGNTGAFPRSSWWSHRNEPDAATNTDIWVKTVQKAGLEPLLMVSPWPGNRTANHTERYVPDDMAAYTAWVTATVERYDGDGVDDMPGLLAPIRYWEVDNEPDLKFTMPPRDPVRTVKPGTFCLPREYATVLVATSKAIRAAHPGALVLNGGIYRPHTESGISYLRDVFAEPGVAEAVDILSLHSYASDEDGSSYAQGVAAARKIVGEKPIFVTETSVASEGEKAWMTPDWQARMVASAVARGAAAGAHAVLWHTIADPPPQTQRKSAFGRHSLLTQAESGTFTDKPAAAVYRNLAARLAEDDLIGAVDAGPGAVRAKSGAILLYQGSQRADKGGVDLRTGQPVAAGATATAPAWLWP